MKDIKWSQLRRDYEHGATYAQLAQLYGASPATICRRARLEGWGRRGSTAGTARPGCLEKVTGQLVEVAGRMMEQQEESMSVKELRDMAALVRELAALQAAQRQQEEGSSVPSICVRLEGDVEKWSV
jgi:uncharacterized protein YjcR